MDKIRHKTKNILVSIDGSIDSIVNVYLLKKQNYRPSGVSFMLEDDSLRAFRAFFDVKEKALEVIAEALDIGIRKFDVSSEFNDQVIGPMLDCLSAGRSFNLEHEVEQFILVMLHQNKEQFNAQFISSPLSAKVLENQKYHSFDILQGAQLESEHSGYLSGLGNNLLESLVLGASDLRASEMEKVFSVTGIDLLGVVHKSKKNKVTELLSSKEFLDYLNQNIPLALKKAGPIRDNQTNSIVGEHLGLYRYHVGMKQFSINNKVENQTDVGKSVVKILASENTIVIDNLNQNIPRSKSLVVSHLRRSCGVDASTPLECFIKIQGARELKKVSLYFKCNQYGLIEFAEACELLFSPGQIVYLYTTKNQKAKLLGSALVEQAGEFHDGLFIEAPFGIVERKYIEKYSTQTKKQTINYL